MRYALLCLQGYICSRSLSTVEAYVSEVAVEAAVIEVSMGGIEGGCGSKCGKIVFAFVKVASSRVDGASMADSSSEYSINILFALLGFTLLGYFVIGLSHYFR